jgi:hypothetical protein
MLLHASRTLLQPHYKQQQCSRKASRDTLHVRPHTCNAVVTQCIAPLGCRNCSVKTNSVPGFVEHHFGQFYAANHPVVLCTDDSGVFATTLSQEYAIAAASFGLNHQQLIELTSRAVEYCFCSEQEKQQLRQTVAEFMTAWRQNQHAAQVAAVGRQQQQQLEGDAEQEEFAQHQPC